MTDRAVLVLNAGSSSLKVSVYRVAGETGLVRMLRGQIERIRGNPRFAIRDGEGATIAEESLGENRAGHEACLGFLLDWLAKRDDGTELWAAGHRVGHGGLDFPRPVRATTDVLDALDALAPLAPLHQPHNIAPIRTLARLHPGLPQVACFDTAFHAGKPRLASLFALPRDMTDAGIRRYGFHGLSYEYIASILSDVAPEIAAGRVVVAHLGSGASMCALKDGRSVDTSMGFTAVDGLPMGTRTGALDPGVVLYLARERGMELEAIEDLLYNRSGLLGVSGISNDMRVLLASQDPRADEAIELFVYRIVQMLGALAAAAGGLDALVFTAGIGERSPEIRRRVLEASAWMGLTLDLAANEAHGPRITTLDSRASAWVIPTNEELMIARHTLAVLADGSEGATE